jgi:hypothetical protein
MRHTLSPNLYPTAAHFMYGYPGLLMLWLATWLTLRQQSSDATPRRTSSLGWAGDAMGLGVTGVILQGMRERMGERRRESLSPI